MSNKKKMPASELIGMFTSKAEYSEQFKGKKYPADGLDPEKRKTGRGAKHEHKPAKKPKSGKITPAEYRRRSKKVQPAIKRRRRLLAEQGKIIAKAKKGKG